MDWKQTVADLVELYEPIGMTRTNQGVYKGSIPHGNIHGIKTQCS